MPVVGTEVVYQIEFRDNAGRLADPNTVTVKVRSPAPATTTYVYPTSGLTKAATGVYEIAFTVTSAGTWTIQAEGAAGVTAVDDTTLTVTAAAI